MVRGAWRRNLIAATAVAALAGIFIQVLVAAGNDEGAVFPTTAGRVFNVFCFFTIQSNLLVAITSTFVEFHIRSSTSPTTATRGRC
jgi:hypothetical protein